MLDTKLLRRRIFTSEEFAADLELQKDLEQACRLAIEECDRDSTQNLNVENWAQNPASLFFLLLREKRFTSGKGVFTTLYSGDKIVAMSGVYLHEVNPLVAIGGVRSWVAKKLRGKFLLASYLLPWQELWARERGCERFWVTFNQYQKAMALRKKVGPSLGTERRALLIGRTDPDFYHAFQLMPELQKIKHTSQYVWEKRLL